jgi:hypothetical protein
MRYGFGGMDGGNRAVAQSVGMADLLDQPPLARPAVVLPS